MYILHCHPIYLYAANSELTVATQGLMSCCCFFQIKVSEKTQTIRVAQFRLVNSAKLTTYVPYNTSKISYYHCHPGQQLKSPLQE